MEKYTPGSTKPGPGTSRYIPESLNSSTGLVPACCFRGLGILHIDAIEVSSSEFILLLVRFRGY
jgi:hypothetical protein